MSDAQFGVLVGLHIVGLGLAIGIFLVLRKYLRNAESVLKMASIYFEMGRTQHKDANRVLDSVQAASDASITPDLVRAVAEMPAKTAKATADAVVSRLDEKASGESGHNLPVVRPADGT